MPYVEVLIPEAEVNTDSEIFEVMANINGCADKKFKASVIYKTRRGGIVCLGDTLEVQDDRMTRWWQKKKKKPSDQLRLPFRLYEPVPVIGASYSDSTMRVRIRRTDSEGNPYTVTLVKGSGNRGNVLAIRLHRITRVEVEEEDQSSVPFSASLTETQTMASEQELRPSPTPPDSATDCPALLNRAVHNGLQITPSGKCYDARTGQLIGSEVSTVVPNGGYDSMIGIRLTGLDGEHYGVNLDQCMVEHIPAERDLTATECACLVDEAVRVGMAVTITGDVYNRVTGELVGCNVRASAGRRDPNGSPWMTHYIRGELRTLNNELYHFQVTPEGITYIDSETFEPSMYQSPPEPNSLFAAMYGSQSESRLHRTGVDRSHAQRLSARLTEMAAGPEWREVPGLIPSQDTPVEGEVELNMTTWQTGFDDECDEGSGDDY